MIPFHGIQPLGPSIIVLISTFSRRLSAKLALYIFQGMTCPGSYAAMQANMLWEQFYSKFLLSKTALWNINLLPSRRKDFRNLLRNGTHTSGKRMLFTIQSMRSAGI